MKQSHFTLIALVLLAVALMATGLYYNTQQGGPNSANTETPGDAFIRDYSPTAGNPTAKVTIVEFMDPACETCRKFHPFVKRLMNANAGKVNLVIRYAPYHQGSDQMVAILEAARKQDKFWEVLELMFDTQHDWASHHVAKPDVFWGYLEGSGLDIARLQQDMNDPAIVDIIQQDLSDAKLLGADKTPTFFVNGKPLPSFGATQLRTLVDAEISANY